MSTAVEERIKPSILSDQALEYKLSRIDNLLNSVEYRDAEFKRLQINTSGLDYLNSEQIFDYKMYFRRPGLSLKLQQIVKEIHSDELRSKLLACEHNHFSLYANKVCGHESELVPMQCNQTLHPKCKVKIIRTRLIALYRALTVDLGDTVNNKSLYCINVNYKSKTCDFTQSDAILDKLKGKHIVAFFRDITKHIDDFKTTTVIFAGSDEHPIGGVENYLKLLNVEYSISKLKDFTDINNLKLYDVLYSMSPNLIDFTPKDVDLYSEATFNRKKQYIKSFDKECNSEAEKDTPKLFNAKHESEKEIVSGEGISPLDPPIEGKETEIYCHTCDKKVKCEYFGRGVIKEKRFVIVNGARYGQTFNLAELLADMSEAGKRLYRAGIAYTRV